MLMTVREAAFLLVALLAAGCLGIRRLGYDEFAIIRNGTAMRVYEVPVFNKSMFVVFVDLVTIAIASYGALGLKTDTWHFATIRATAVTVRRAKPWATIASIGALRGLPRVAGMMQ